GGESGASFVSNLAECEVPRLPLSPAFYHSIRAVRFPGRILQQYRSPAVALLVRDQSDGGRARRVPMVSLGRREPPLPAQLRTESPRNRCVHLAWRFIFPENRAQFCGFPLICQATLSSARKGSVRST